MESVAHSSSLLDRSRPGTTPGNVHFIDPIPFIVKPGDLLTVIGATVLIIALTTM